MASVKKFKLIKQENADLKLSIKELKAKLKEESKANKVARRQKEKEFKELTKQTFKLQKKINAEPTLKVAAQASFIAEYLQKITVEGEEVWSPATARLWGEKKLLKYKPSQKDAEVKKYTQQEMKRIEAMFEDSLKKLKTLKIGKLYLDEIHDVNFDDLVVKKMYGCSIHMSMPSIGANYVDYGNMCVPMGLLNYLNNPEKAKEQRIQSMTLEAIVEILNTENMENSDKTFEEKLCAGYTPQDVMRVCSDERVRIRMYCLDHREKCILSNAKQIPDNKRNKKMPNLVFMTWNSHFYMIEDMEVKESVAHTYKCREIGARHKSSIKNEENKKKRVSVVKKYIPRDFSKYKDMLMYIESPENIVNEFFYDELKHGVVHKNLIRVKDQEVLRFEYTPTKTLLMYKPDYSTMESLCHIFNSNLEENERKYEIENHTIHSLALEYYERNYGHALSHMNTDGNEVMNSPLNSAFNEYWKYPPFKKGGDIEDFDFTNCHQYDFSKHYTSCLLNTEWGFSVYSPLNEITLFDGKLKEGFYYVETTNYFPMKGNGWYNGEPLVEYIQDGIISIIDIKYQYLPSRKLEKEHFHEFVKTIYDTMSEKCAKQALNGFIGLMRKVNSKSSISYFTTDKDELCCHYNNFINQGFDLEKVPVNYIENDEGETVAYHIIDEKSYPLERTNIPIYRKIYDMSALFLWRLIKEVGGMNYVLGIHTDTVYFQGGKRLSEDGKMFGGIRKVIPAPWEHINLVKREVKREYFYRHKDDREDVEVEKIFDLEKGALITGRAGTGKSYLIHRLKKYFQEHEAKYDVCATTWKAGIKVDGTTIHSTFGIDPLRPRINISACMALHTRGVRYIIIDEISMITETMWGILHQIKDICGFVFYCFGDYNQLPPPCEEDVYHRFENSRLISFVVDNRRCKLEKIWRIKEGEEVFFDELEKVLNGEMVDTKLYGNKECEFAIAYHNAVVDKHNMKWMEINAKKYGTYELINGKNQKIYLFNGLKVIANMTNKAYVNCEDFVVVSYDKNSVIIKNARQELTIPREELMKCFKPYYAITVHKAQGETFDFPFTIYEYRTLFRKGKNFLYTALSRSTSIKHINLVDCPVGDKIGYIYMYKNVKNGKKYIGSTFDEEGRKKQHKESKENDKFHVALRSGENFTYSIIRRVDVFDDEDLRRREAYFIEKYDTVNNGYNSKAV